MTKHTITVLHALNNHTTLHIGGGEHDGTVIILNNEKLVEFIGDMQKADHTFIAKDVEYTTLQKYESFMNIMYKK